MRDSIERGIDGVKEVRAKTRPFVLVPQCGVLQVRRRLQAQGGSGDSPFGQPPGDARAHVFPRFAG